MQRRITLSQQLGPGQFPQRAWGATPNRTAWGPLGLTRWCLSQGSAQYPGRYPLPDHHSSHQGEIIPDFLPLTKKGSGAEAIKTAQACQSLLWREVSISLSICNRWEEWSPPGP